MDAHDLFGLPLERFIGERTALIKELRARGERDQAKRVAALRKPSLAAWAVNQLVRTQSPDVQALFDAGDGARHAQAELLTGRSGGTELREALDREREAVSRLLGAARGLLSSEGHELSLVMLERVADTLHAAAFDADARKQVEDGCLQRELRHVGIGAAGLAGESPGAPSKKRPRRDRPRVDARALSQAEAAAQRAAKRARKAADASGTKRKSAAEALRRAEKAVAEAERRAEEAERTHRRARRALDDATRQG